MANNKDFKVKNGIQPTVYHEAVGTVTSGSEGFVDPSNWSYANKSFDTTSQIATEQDVQFKSDGSKMYVLDYSGSIYQYSLSTAWDVSTASYDSTSFVSDTQDDEFISFKFKPDGTKVYIGGNTNNTIFQYSLSTAWDISTATYDSKSLNITTQGPFPCGIAFKPDGTKVFIADGDDINEYALSTAWDISTGSYTTVFDHGTQDTQGFGIDINDDGTKLYLMGLTNDTVFQYDLSTAYDLSTISYNSKSFSVTSQDTLPRAATFGDSGTKMYVCGSTNGKIFQYSTAINTQTLDQSTGSVFEITPTSDIKIGLSNPAASGTVSAATLLLDGSATIDFSTATYNSVSFSTSAQNAGMLGLAFSTDGTSMYTSGTSGTEAVYQYTLTTAWDLSTASYASKSFDVSTQVTTAYDVDFSGDGTSMYVMDNGTDTLYQYTLSTAFDVSTASYASKSFDVSSQDNNPTGFTFNNDGTKLYVSGVGSNNTFQYDLSTAYDISTASYNNVFLFTGASGVDAFQSHRSLVFAQGGTKLFTLGTSGTDYINQFNLTTPYDISTGSYSGIQFDIDAVATGGKAGFAFAPDNVGKFYIVTGGTTDTINEIDMTSSTATITYDSTIEFAGGTAPTSPAIGDTDILTFSTRDGGTTYQSVLAIDGAK